MHGERPSVTAMLVSLARGASNDPDPCADALLPLPLSLYARALRRLPFAARRALTAGLVDHLALRTAAIDRALGVAAADGARQVVLLGAGLDARAWRLGALAGSRVFEVDHPSTQAWKRARTARLGAPRAEVTLVPVDFTRDDLGAALAAAGHDAAARTAWVWRGSRRTSRATQSRRRSASWQRARRKAPAPR